MTDKELVNELLRRIAANNMAKNLINYNTIAYIDDDYIEIGNIGENIDFVFDNNGKIMSIEC